MPWIGRPESQCLETAGFLFKHPCDRPPAHACQACAKPICVDHTRVVDARRLCVTCAGAAAIDDRDPYFYGRSYYGYGWHTHPDRTDPNDFTDGDATNLQQPGDAAFEDDLDAS